MGVCGPGCRQGAFGGHDQIEPGHPRHNLPLRIGQQILQIEHMLCPYKARGSLRDLWICDEGHSTAARKKPNKTTKPSKDVIITEDIDEIIIEEEGKKPSTKPGSTIIEIEEEIEVIEEEKPKPIENLITSLEEIIIDVNVVKEKN